jgi:ankyrin repeat protein
MTWIDVVDCAVQLLGSGSMALHRASQNGHTECVRLLLDRGASVDVLSVSGWQVVRPLAQARRHGVAGASSLCCSGG